MKAGPALAFAAVLLLYSAPIGGNARVTPYPNEMPRILLAVSLAADRSIRLDRAVEAYGTEEDLALRDGHAYCDKAPGVSLAAAPIAWASAPILPRWGETRYPDYWPLRNLLTWLLSALPGALLPFLSLRGRTPLAAGEPALATLLAVTTPIFAYATTLFGHVPAAALVAAAWALALDGGRERRRHGQVRMFVAGAAAGLAIATEYPTAILMAVLVGAMIAGRRGAREISAFAVGAFLCLLPALAHNALAFGAPWATGYAFKAGARDAAIHATGFAGIALPSAARLFGVLFSASRGLLFYCPLLLLAPPGLVAMARRDRPGALALAAACCGYGLFAGGFVDWKGGWGAAARHLVPIVPLLFVPVAHAVAGLRERAAGRALVAALAAVSLANAILTLAVSPNFPASFEAPLAQVAVPCLRDGIAMPNALTAAFGIHPLVVAALWAAAASALAAWALAGLLPSRRRLVWIPATLVLCAAASVAIQWEASPGVTREQELVRAWYLERLGETAHAKEIWARPR